MPSCLPLRFLSLLLASTCLAACDDGSPRSGGRDAGDDGGARDAAADATADASLGDASIYPCNQQISSTFGADAFIELNNADCEFTLAEVAAGITFPYTVKIANDIEEVVSDGDDGGCLPDTSDGFPVWIKVTVAGGDERYCVCDQGICPAETTPATWAAGDYAREFEWDGKNWNGPSDTVNPKGDAFPPGEYTVTFSASGEAGGDPFELETTTLITITE